MGALEKSSKNFSRKSHIAENESFPHSLTLYITEHTRLVPQIEKLSSANQNRARKTLILCQPIKIEHEKTLQLRQPIRIEYYVTRVVSQSESSITSPESSRLGWRSLLYSRLESARYSLSFYIGTSTTATWSAHYSTTIEHAQLKLYHLDT